MGRLLIYCDANERERSIRLVGASDAINGGRNELYGVCLTDEIGTEQGKFDYWIQVPDERIKAYDPTQAAACLRELQEQYQFDCILIPATQFGRSLAPRLAMMLEVGLVADVTEIRQTSEQVEFIRPAFDGKLLASVVHVGKAPVMASIDPDVFDDTMSAERDTQTITYTPQNIPETSVTLLNRRPREVVQDIRTQQVLISGGGGVKEAFSKLEPLAKALGGMVSASRRAVDYGAARRTIQVGQSGKIVSPDLYLALGIHGSMQHVEGLKDVRHLICVNTNRNAPLCSLADIVVEGDAAEFVEKLLARIEQGSN